MHLKLKLTRGHLLLEYYSHRLIPITLEFTCMGAFPVGQTLKDDTLLLNVLHNNDILIKSTEFCMDTPSHIQFHEYFFLCC